jgi:hypothetical protein
MRGQPLARPTAAQPVPGRRLIGRVALHGFLLWLVPLALSFVSFPLKQASSPLFETLMAVTLTACATLFSVLTLRGHGGWRFGLVVGLAWLAISLALDLALFVGGPMAMGLGAYLQDIGLTYLIFPIVTTGIGIALDRRSQ